MSRLIARPVVLAACLLALSPANAHAGETTDEWQFAGSIYGWFPDIEGDTRLGAFGVDIGAILDNLEFTFQGAFDARRGRWGVATDVIYLDVRASDANVRSGTVGSTQIPVDVRAQAELEMESWIWSAAGYYRALDRSGQTVDLLAGFRYIDIEQDLEWTLTGNVGPIPLPDRQGAGSAGLSNWDAIVGVRGRFAFGADQRWFVPYHLDGGTGESDFTWQAMAGLGYAFQWGQVLGFWHYLDYDLGSGVVEDANFNGPGVGVVIRW
jgi:hypothetical protein